MKKRIISFLWQHLLLIVSLSIMTCGVALCIRPNFSSSVIATIPFIIALAEEASIVSLFTIVEYTHIMNFLFIGLQILILHQRFPRIQLFQFIIGFVFGFLLDVNMWPTSIIVCNKSYTFWNQQFIMISFFQCQRFK
ncbi:hypothetical protein AA415_00324 [Bacteroides stercoris]|uniref:Uncharacterized protein n=1 Tax=Bacteroides stercoris TaxID=46506 RepID=A0A108TD76_BACSE|nr:hypothetical protein AA415_00324 [Bacteroides stercoris]